MTNFEMVQEFHKVFAPAQHHVGEPSLRDVDIQDLRADLIREEFTEFVLALHDLDLVGVADALGDLLYVVYGAADAFGINADAVFAEIHRSNMTKLDLDGKPIYRGDGKVMKGPGYEPPDLKKVLGL